MRSIASSLHGLLLILVAPRAAFALLRQQPRLGMPLVLIGTTAATLLFAQSFLVEPALQEPFRAGKALGSSGSPPAWLTWLRLLVVLAAPLGIVLRATALGSTLHALQAAAGGKSTWRQCTSLSIHLEMVYLVESVCTLLLLVLVRPQSFTALQELHLRAGIDLFWQPPSAFLQSLTSALNLFVLWWGTLLMEGAARLGGLRRRRAVLLALPLWLVALGVRVVLQPR